MIKLVSKEFNNWVWAGTEYFNFPLRLSWQELEAAIIQIVNLHPNLKKICLFSCDITNVGLKKLAGLKSLTSLDLSYCKQLTDVRLKELAGLKSLTSLDLSGCNLTDVGLKEIVHLKSLTSLDLSFCKQLTDVGLEELWLQLDI